MRCLNRGDKGPSSGALGCPRRALGPGLALLVSIKAASKNEQSHMAACVGTKAPDRDSSSGVMSRPKILKISQAR